MDTNRTYTLTELAEEFGLTERTARYYIEKVLPPHHKKGRGKVARYGQDTWNCFAFIRMVRERYGFGPSQIGPVLADIAQETVDRVVNGEEELAVMGVVPPAPKTAPMRRQHGMPRASMRAMQYSKREMPSQELSFRVDCGPAMSRAAPEPPAVAADEEGDADALFEEAAPEAAEEGGWQTLFADEQLRIQHNGPMKLSHLQEEQVRVAAWLIKEAL
ncbi:MAG: MerR family transcriptional regulator [Xanthomonadales bacterium]|nr:MerR family transcriptional regulator [Xanthomonadales bacterium]NIX12826.1 MerR family transcriptional regulator [Xanthomonadales bacterium]